MVAKDGRERERHLIEVLGSGQHGRAEVDRVVRELPAGERLGQREEWLGIVRNEGLEPWRRLLAYQLLLSHGTSYPANFERFWGELLAPLGIERGRIVDMTMGSHVPVRRDPDTAVNMVSLPIQTLSGAAALYYSVRREDGAVVDARVNPDPVAPEQP